MGYDYLVLCLHFQFSGCFHLNFVDWTRFLEFRWFFIQEGPPPGLVRVEKQDYCAVAETDPAP